MESHSMGFIFIFVEFISVIHARTPCDFPAIFNFGDSNSDTGGLSAAFGQFLPPNGESYFGGPAGRVCDGRLMIDFMAESLGLPYLNAIFDSLRPDYTHGANFAYSGSSIRNANLIPVVNPFSFSLQFTQFDNFRLRSKKSYNQEGLRALVPKPEDFSRALYTLDIGHNDMHSIFNVVKTSKERIAAEVVDMLDKFRETVGNISNAGGGSFWIHNVGPLGCLPNILLLYAQNHRRELQFDKVGCSIYHNKVVQYFNRELKKTVVQLRKDFPLAAFTYVDIYTVKYTLFSQAKKHGFEDPLQVCCGYGGIYNYNLNITCGFNGTLNGRHIFVGKCKHPYARINWDGTHLTEATNKWVFDHIVNGSFSDPPIPLRMACHNS